LVATGGLSLDTCSIGGVEKNLNPFLHQNLSGRVLTLLLWWSKGTLAKCDQRKYRVEQNQTRTAAPWCGA
jgi:hypothetical protein